MAKTYQTCLNCGKKGVYLSTGVAYARNCEKYGAATVTYVCRYCHKEKVIKPEYSRGTMMDFPQVEETSEFERFEAREELNKENEPITDSGYDFDGNHQDDGSGDATLADGCPF